MLSQSSQFSSAIYTHAAFISFERRLTEIKKKREKKKNTVTKKLRKEIHQLLNRLLNHSSPNPQFYNDQTHPRNKQTSTPIIKYSKKDRLLRLSRDTRKGKRTSPPQGYQEPSIQLGRRSCRFKAGKSPSTLKPPRNRDISRVVWIVWYLYKA